MTRKKPQLTNAQIDKLLTWVDSGIMIAMEERSKHFKNTDKDRKVVAVQDARIVEYTEIKHTLEAMRV